MPRQIEIRSKAEKDLRSIPKRDGERMAKAILALRSGAAGDVKSTIFRILHRREAYRGKP